MDTNLPKHLPSQHALVAVGIYGGMVSGIASSKATLRVVELQQTPNLSNVSALVTKGGMSTGVAMATQ